MEKKVEELRREILKRVFQKKGLTLQEKEKSKRKLNKFIEKDELGLVLHTKINKEGDSILETLITRCDGIHIDEIIELIKKESPALYKSIKTKFDADRKEEEDENNIRGMVT